MPFFQKKFLFILLLFTLPLLFLPKINLISFGSETAGIRIDDVILLFLGILIVWAHVLLRKKIEKIEIWILLLTAFSFLSFFSNKILVHLDVLHMDAKIFYVVRLFEYFLFFYIGSMAAYFFSGNGVVRAFFLWNFFLMTLQKFGLLGGLTVEGYKGSVAERVQGIASFPSEMGLILNLLFCYLIYDKSSQSKIVNLFSPSLQHFFRRFYLYWMFFIFGLFVVFTGNRISILALFVCFLFRVKDQFRMRSLASFWILVSSIVILAAGIGYFVMQTASVYERSLNLFSWKNLELAQVVWDKINLNIDPISEGVTSSTDYDMSWWLRIHKWMYVLKAYTTNPIVYLQGLGPGFAWSALDGGWLRIWVEYGIVGVFIFLGLFSTLYRINVQTKWMMIAFGINMIFFDAYLAYKTMSVLFFASGYIWERQQIVNKSLCMKAVYTPSTLTV